MFMTSQFTCMSKNTCLNNYRSISMDLEHIDGSDSSDDDRLINTFSVERRTRRREFFAENLPTIEHLPGECRKRKLHDCSSFKRIKYQKYDEDSENLTKTSNCRHCRQSWQKARINRFNENDFPESQNEETLLNDVKLNIVSDIEKAQIKLTSYSVYDKKMHLCTFDDDGIKEGLLLYAAGFAKPINCENSDIIDGIPVKNIGPLTSWWIIGFDSGEKAILGISTDLADYYLMKPDPKYEPFLKDANHKTVMAKLIIKFLKESDECDATYDNLLYKLQITVPPCGYKSLSEEDLLLHLDSVYELVMDYIYSANDDAADQSFVNTPCMRHLAYLAQIPYRDRLCEIRVQKKNISYMKRNNELIKTATTNLVENVFESLFPEQMEKGSTAKLHLIKECQVVLRRCDNMYNGDPICASDDDDKTNQLPLIKELRIVLERIDVESYKNGKSICNSMSTFGRPFSILLETWTDQMIEKYRHGSRSNPVSLKKRRGRYRLRAGISSDVDIKFLDESIFIQDDRYYFGNVEISNLKISINNYVAVSQDYEVPGRIGKVMSIWKQNDDKSFHIHWLAKAADTILGDIGNSQELFDTYDCSDLPLSMIEDKVEVTFLPIDRLSWIQSGNTSFKNWENSSKTNDGKTFFFQKSYNSSFGRFEDVEVYLNENSTGPGDNCRYCDRRNEKELLEIPMVKENPDFHEGSKQHVFESVRWRNDEFKVGSCVFLMPGVLHQYERSNNSRKNFNLKDIDEERYPEMYRKLKERQFSRSADEFVDPFEIGCIVSIHSPEIPLSAKDISITVKKFYRPENTHLDEHITKHLDLNLLYWSDEESVVKFDKIQGKCYVANIENLDCPVDEWTTKGPYRFYYKEAYVSREKKFTPLPTVTTGKFDLSDKISEQPKLWASIPTPLRSLDIFAGCGGLTEGLHQVGIANCCWAIEKEETAAHAFRLNYPNAVVYTEDCNDLLKMIMNGQSKKDGQTLPQKGEVELLCGGPPCQGFSRMNRFNDRQYSCFKNSLVVSFLSYVDYFRPRYVVMENVRNFVAFKNNMVLKLTMQCLVKMGYQCTFGVLQAGHFGVPQNRRRAILFAAAPGEILPVFPEPTSSFGENAITVLVDGKKVSTNVNWQNAAPYRKLTAYDVISDLPVIEGGGDPHSAEMSYDKDTKTHVQRLIRASNDILWDHVSKATSVLVEKRISFIPKLPGSDWRDLPNIVVQLSDGTYTNELVYTHDDLQSGRGKNGRFRGVCCCASGRTCNSRYRQMDTLIPWCLPHTGNRNHHWSGLYGRVEWDSHFKTITTNLEPMAKQGTVIHPDQDRILSVRELARAQGFPDTFRFFGTVQDKIRQIGNAVPPPLAAALGREITKAVIDNSKFSSIDNIEIT